MKNHAQLILVVCILIFAILACNLPSSQPNVSLSVTPCNTATPTADMMSPSTPAPCTPSPVPSQSTPTMPLSTPGTPSQSGALLPSPTSPPTVASPTPSSPIVWPIDKGVNCRYGPGTAWAPEGALLVGQVTKILGKTDDSTWWEVGIPDDSGDPCWVAASATNTAGNVQTIKVITGPFNPWVINLSVTVDPDTINCLRGNFYNPKVQVKGTLNVSGPGEVDWKMVSSEGDSITGPQSSQFNSFGSYDVYGTFSPKPPAGTYQVLFDWLLAGTTRKEATVDYKMVCN